MAILSVHPLASLISKSQGMVRKCKNFGIIVQAVQFRKSTKSTKKSIKNKLSNTKDKSSFKVIIFAQRSWFLCIDYQRSHG